MLDPIRTPLGTYRQPFDVQHLLYSGPQPAFAEPLLIHRSDVPWQAGSKQYRDTGVVGVGEVWRSPKLGGKITVCVLCSGPYFGLHQRCLASIKKSIPDEFLDLRVGLNGVGEKTARYVTKLRPTRIYTQPAGLKYPTMRKMLWDPECPVTTPYMAWFDDTAEVVDPNWLNTLGTIILKQTLPVGMYGLKLYTFLEGKGSNPTDWLKQADWYRGKLLKDPNGRESAYGTVVHYCAGWFWAAPTSVIRAANIPCPSLHQRGGEVVIGEQLHQAGFELKQFNGGQLSVKRLPQSQIPRAMTLSPFPWQ